MFVRDVHIKFKATTVELKTSLIACENIITNMSVQQRSYFSLSERVRFSHSGNLALVVLIFLALGCVCNSGDRSQQNKTTVNLTAGNNNSAQTTTASVSPTPTPPSA
jgi:hypothetical protein